MIWCFYKWVWISMEINWYVNIFFTEKGSQPPWLSLPPYFGICSYVQSRWNRIKLLFHFHKNSKYSFVKTPLHVRIYVLAWCYLVEQMNQISLWPNFQTNDVNDCVLSIIVRWTLFLTYIRQPVTFIHSKLLFILYINIFIFVMIFRWHRSKWHFSRSLNEKKTSEIQRNKPFPFSFYNVHVYSYLFCGNVCCSTFDYKKPSVKKHIRIADHWIHCMVSILSKYARKQGIFYFCIGVSSRWTTITKSEYRQNISHLLPHRMQVGHLLNISLSLEMYIGLAKHCWTNLPLNKI